MKGVFIIEERNYLVVDQYGNVADHMFAVPVGTVVRTQADIERARAFKERKANQRSDYPFTFLLQEGAKRLSNLKPITVTRLIYLSSYLSYDNNILYYKRNQKITKYQLQEVLGVSKRTADEFAEEACGAGILIDSAEGLKLDTAVFCRGAVENKNEVLIKLFHYSVKALYDKNNNAAHRCIGYAMKALTHLNTSWNVLCHNTLEKQWDNVRPVSPTEFCDITGYTKNQARRLVNLVRDIRFPCKGYDQLFCNVIYDPETEDEFFVFNPFLLCAGHNNDLVEELCPFLEEAKCFREAKQMEGGEYSR